MSALVAYINDLLELRSMSRLGGAPPDIGDGFAPIERFFPRARLGRFVVEPWKSFVAN